MWRQISVQLVISAFTLDFHGIFHIISFINTNEDAMKYNQCEKLENYQEWSCWSLFQ